MKAITILMTCAVFLAVGSDADARSRRRSPASASVASQEATMIKGYSPLEAFDYGSRRIVLKGERYAVDGETRYENEYGERARPRDFVPAQVDGGLTDVDSGSKVYFEVHRKTGRVRLLRLVTELPS